MNLARLKDVVTLEYGSALPKDESSDLLFNAFGSNGSFSKSPLANTSGETIIVGRKGSFGKINYSNESVYCTDTAYFIDKSKTLEDLRFIYYVLHTLELDSVSADVGVPGLSRNEAYLKKLSLPMIDKQKKISESLDRYSECIERQLLLLKQKLLHLDEYKTALIHNAVTKGLDSKGCRILDGTPAAEMTWKPSGVEWIGDVPDGWDVGSYSELSYINGYAYSSDLFDLEKGIPVVRIGDVGTDKTDKMYAGSEGLHVVVEKGDLLLGLSGDVKYAVWNGGYSLLNQRVLSIRSSNSRLINFVENCIGFCVSEIMLTSTSTTIKNISLDQVRSFKYPIMESAELDIISDYLAGKNKCIDDAKKAINKKISMLVEYKKSLINEAVSGH